LLAAPSGRRPPEDENSLIEWPADVRFLAHLL
jgi:hypothetical protein